MKQKKAILIIFILFMTSISGFTQVNVEKYRILKDKDGFSTGINISATLIKGNTEIINIDAESGIFYKKGKNQFIFKAILNFGEKNDNEYINKGFLHLRSTREISKQLGAEMFLQTEFNEFILLRNRKVGGAGVRLKIYQKKNLSIHTGVGLMYEAETFSERSGIILKEDTKYIKSTNYIALNWKFSKTASFGLVTYYQTRFTGFSDYRFLSDISLSFRLSGNLNFFSTINHRYDNSPPETIKKYDLTLKTGIGISF